VIGKRSELANIERQLDDQENRLEVLRRDG
jgi:hypothetical protein